MTKHLRLLPALTLLACGGGDSPTEPPPPSVPTSVTLSSTEVVFDALGGSVPLTAVVQDQNGQAMAGRTVMWTTADASVVFVSGSGVLTARGNGQTVVTATSGAASAQATVTVAQVTATLTLGPDPLTLPWPGASLALTVRALDARAFSVADLEIAWGSTDPAVVQVDDAGTVTAVGAGSALVHGTSGDVSDTVSVQVTASSLDGPRITSVSPAVLLEGELATITGEGFGDLPELNHVQIGDDPVEVLEASPSGLTIRVPESACLPTRTASLRLDAFGGWSVQDVPVQPRDVASPEVGQALYGDDCIRLAGAPEGARYMVGLVSTSQVPSSVSEVRLSTAVGEELVATAPPRARTTPGPVFSPLGGLPTGAAPSVRPPSPAVMPPEDPWARQHAEAEARIRQSEEEWFRRLGPPSLPRAAQAAGPSMVPPSQGDTIRISVPDGCSDGTQIRTVARYVGDALVFLEDVENPVLEALPLETMEDFDALYVDAIGPTLTDYFGTMSDLDDNGRLLVVMTREVNEREGVLGFVYGVDLFPKTSCSASNEGELFYGLAPDPDGTLGRQVSLERIWELYPTLITHEATHVVQLGRRYFDGAGSKASWETEGGATLAEHLTGFRVRGHAPLSNLGWAEVEAATPPGWYNDWWRDMTYYFGFNGSEQVVGAPQQCSWAGRTSEGNDGPCWNGRAPYGVPSTFLRMVLDRYGESHPGGEEALMRDLTGGTERGIPNVAEVTGIPGDELVALFSISLWADDRVGDWIPSWNVADVFAALPEDRQLRTFSAPIEAPVIQTSVRALSTAYVEWSPPGTPPPAGLRLTDAAGGPAPPNTLLWVLRIQ
ncbi:MAG: Ig-like domain-containing protein [Gemmatimonadales bacterium]|nr:MAG: Ig-like domain-containing protein [Gemmatimonadales bacterium]